MQQQELALGLRERLVVLSLHATDGTRSISFHSTEVWKRTHHCLLEQERIDRLFCKAGRGDDEDLELVKVEVSVHGIVDLHEELGVRLQPTGFSSVMQLCRDAKRKIVPLDLHRARCLLLSVSAGRARLFAAGQSSCGS